MGIPDIPWMQGAAGEEQHSLTGGFARVEYNHKSSLPLALQNSISSSIKAQHHEPFGQSGWP